MRVLLVVLTLWATVACGATEGPASTEETVPPRPTRAEANSPGGPEGDLAPDFTVTTFEGDVFALGERRGTPVVLNFWESW